MTALAAAQVNQSGRDATFIVAGSQRSSHAIQPCGGNDALMCSTMKSINRRVLGSCRRRWVIQAGHLDRLGRFIFGCHWHQPPGRQMLGHLEMSASSNDTVAVPAPNRSAHRRRSRFVAVRTTAVRVWVRHLVHATAIETRSRRRKRRFRHSWPSFDFRSSPDHRCMPLPNHVVWCGAHSTRAHIRDFADAQITESSGTSQEKRQRRGLRSCQVDLAVGSIAGAG